LALFGNFRFSPAACPADEMKGTLTARQNSPYLPNCE
jgi:hypothetical protein